MWFGNGDDAVTCIVEGDLNELCNNPKNNQTSYITWDDIRADLNYHWEVGFLTFAQHENVSQNIE